MLTYLDATADAETVSSVLRSDGVVGTVAHAKAQGGG